VASRTLSLSPQPAPPPAPSAKVIELPRPPASTAPEPSAAAPCLPRSTSRHRGTHLVGEPPSHGLHLAPPPTTSADRARNIVAQVQWEIEQKAARQRSSQLAPRLFHHQLVPLQALPASIARDTPLVVLRRLARSLGLIHSR
jgi:hypothetical protein